MIQYASRILQGKGLRLLLAAGMLFVAILTLTTIPASAQEPTAEEDATEAESSGEEAEATEDVRQALADEIVVTARRREENV